MTLIVRSDSVFPVLVPVYTYTTQKVLDSLPLFGLLERHDDDLHRTPSQESPESHAKGMDQETAALSMAEIASCSYEAR